MKWIAWIQAAYFVLTGVWPIVHMRSFLLVTGPKTDLWLVKTVGVLVTAIGAAIALAAWQNQISAPVILLAIGSAGALAAIDVIHVAKRTINQIYLLDALAEVILIVTWIVATSAS